MRKATNRKKTDPLPVALLAGLLPADVLSVYSGQDGRCCCGCAGKHSYQSANVAAASRDRGYKVTADEVNDAMVTRVLRLVKARLAESPANVFSGRSHFSTVVGARVYVVYPKASARLAKAGAR